MVKKLRDFDEKVESITPTTIRILKLDVVKKHIFNNNKTINAYINNLIKQDILKNGNMETITKYFKEQKYENK